MLYAFSGTMKTPVTTPTYMPEVEMKFKHLLSRLTLTFHNDLVNPHYFVNAHSIMLCNVSAKGTINMTQPKPLCLTPPLHGNERELKAHG